MERTVHFTVLQIAIPRVKISTNHVKIAKKVGVVIVQKVIINDLRKVTSQNVYQRVTARVYLYI